MNILFIISVLAFAILFAAYVRLARKNKRRTRPYSWIRSDKHLPQTKRQVLLFLDNDVREGCRDIFRYRTAYVEENDNGTKVFVVPFGNYIPSSKIWWRDLIPPDEAKHYDEGIGNMEEKRRMREDGRWKGRNRTTNYTNYTN